MIGEIQVSLVVYTDEETQAEHILMQEKEAKGILTRVAELEAEARKQKESAEKSLREEGEAKQIAVNEMRRNLEQELKITEAYSDRAEVRYYTLVKPSWRVYREAIAAAKTIDQNSGNIIVDEDIIRDTLMPLCLRGMERKEIDSLSPNIYLYLWMRVRTAILPDNKRLPF